MPSRFKSSRQKQSNWLSLTSFVVSLCRKSDRWSEICWWTFATFIRCFSLFFDPFCFFESFLCSHLSLSKACLKYSDESILVPLLKFKKCFKPKSIPRLFYAEISLLNSGYCSYVWTMKLMKYCPDGFFEIVAVPSFPFLTFLLSTNLMRLSPPFFVLMNFGIWIFFALKSIFTPPGHSKL